MFWLVFCPVFSVEQPVAYSNMLPVTRLEDGTKSGAILFNLFFPRPLSLIPQSLNQIPFLALLYSLTLITYIPKFINLTAPTKSTMQS